MSLRRKSFIVFVATTALLVLVWHSGGNSDFDEISHAQGQIETQLDSQMVDVGHTNLHVVFAGPEDGEPVILIHGFPEFWYMWRYHIDSLAKEGYRVAAPDMRGYNRSDKPSGRKSYEFSDYTNDITGLMDAQGWKQANIVGHDIGARVSWKLVFDDPERVKRAVIFSVGHPLAFETSTDKSDISWYRTFFNMPIFPELLSRLGGLSLIEKNIIKSSREGTFDDTELNVYRASWDRDHAFDSMLGAYRNFDDRNTIIPESGQPEIPVFFVFGLEDKFISADIAERTKIYLGAENVKIYTDLSHWIINEDRKATISDIITFLETKAP